MIQGATVYQVCYLFDVVLKSLVYLRYVLVG
jgi:hypothetical protein